MIYNTNGSIKVTVVDGTSPVGVYSTDGSINVVLNDGNSLTGVQHASGAYNAIKVTEAPERPQAPNGSLYVIHTADGYVFHDVNKDFPTPFSLSSLTPTVWLEPAKGGLFQSNTGATEASVDNDAVGYLPDYSGNGNHYTSALDDTTRPTLQGVSSFPRIRFDGVNDVLQRTSSLGLYAAGSYTLAVCLKGNTPATDSRVFAEGNTATTNTLFIPIQTSASTSTSSALMYRNDAGLQQTGSLNVANVFEGNDHVFTITDDGTTIRSYLDGVAGDTLNYSRGTYTLNRSAIGALVRAATSNWWSGDIYGLMAVGRVLTDTERNNTTTYLGNLAGLTL